MDGGTVPGLSPLLIRKNPAACSKVFSPKREPYESSCDWEWAMRISILHDVLRQHSIQSGHSCQERRRRGVHIHPDRIHAIFDCCIERSRQRPLVHVMLILSYPDGFRVDFDQLGQRILQSARNRHSTAQTDIQGRKPAAANAEAE